MYYTDYYLNSGECKRTTWSCDPDEFSDIQSYAKKNLGGWGNVWKTDTFHFSEPSYQLYTWNGTKWLKNEHIH